MKKSSTSKSQNKVEIALNESEQRYRTTMMSVGDGVIATDTEGRVEMMNPVAEELTGWIQEEARGKSLEAIFHIINEETRLTIENPVRRVMLEGIVVGLANHTVLIAKDGTEHPIADSGSPIRNENGEMTGVVLVFHDQTQERMAQKSLQESERKFRETIKYLDEGYYSCSMDGVLLDHNQAFNRILGFDINKDLKGSKLPDFWQNPDDRKVYLKELMERGFIRNYIINAKTIGGEKIVVMANSHLVKDEKGGLLRIEGIYNDFTRLKLTEDALKESEAKYRTLFENAQVGMYRSKIDGSAMLDVNKKFGEILGLTHEESLGKAGRILWANPEDRDKMMKLLKEQGGILNNYEASLLAKNGEVRNVLASIELHPNEGSLDGTFVDITERKRAEKVIKDNENRFRELIESLPQLFWTCRVDGPCDYLSKQWVEYTGIPESEQLGYRWLEQLHADDRDGTVSEWMEKVKTGNSFDIEFRIRRNDGVYRWFKTTAVPMHDSEGNIVKWFGSNTDFDDIKKTKEHLRKLNRIYSLLSDINQAIVRTHIPKELFDKVCDIAVDQGGFGMAWIGLIDESSQKLQVIAQAGRTDGYHEKVNISLKGEPLIYCPVDSALRQGKHKICNIIENEEMAPCQKIAFELGFRSSGSFPLRVSDILKGAITFYSDEPGFFDEAELKLLDELALDISFAMEYNEKETGNKRAEEALKASEKRFRIAAGSLIDVVYEWDLKDKIEWYGDIDGIMGYPADGFPRTLAGWAAKLHPEDTEKVMAAIEGHLKRSEPYISEYRVMNKEGQWRWWSARGSALRDEQNLPYWWIGSITDITDRKQVEVVLKISKERLLFATEGANLGIWNWNIVTGELIWSDQCKALFGVPPDETMSYQRFRDALHPDDRERTDKAVKYTLDNHKDFDIEYRSLWPDESIHWLAAKGRGFYDTTGKAVRLEGIVLDIAESKRKEEEICKLNAELEDRVAIRTSQLEASYKELEAFSYSVSHDLRAPLRHVSGYVELLNKHFQSDLPEKGKHYLSSIADSVRIMGMLIDDLLQFSKTGRMEMHQSDFDMNEIVKEVIESLVKDNPDRKIEWIVGKLVSVNGDEAMLKLVWINLLSNAVKFTRTRRKARIEIGVLKEKKDLVFFVRDNGVGFDMQYAQKLFGVFQRLHPAEEFEGTGIGLANVNRIVLRHGGRTWAKGEPDKGAEFNFSIPNK
jgi:PAS domain S-box-containing protein